MEPESAAREAQGNIADEDYEEGVPSPTLSDVRYGEHERHVLDFSESRVGQTNAAGVRRSRWGMERGQ